MTPHPRDSADTQGHCEHECVCPRYANTNAYGYPCTRNTGLMGTVVTAPCEHDTRVNQKEHDAQVAAKENKRVLDAIWVWRKDKEMKGNSPEGCVMAWLEEDIMLESLRQREQPK